MHGREYHTMSAPNSMTGRTGKIKSFIRQSVSPRLTNFYARLGFADRGLFTQNLKGLDIQNHGTLLDILAKNGILKQRFRDGLNSLENIEDYMLAGSVTLRQVQNIEKDIDRISTVEKLSGILESLSNAAAAEAEAAAINEMMEGKHLSIENLFSHTTLNMGGMLDRIFPNSEGIHSKLAKGLDAAINFTGVANLNGGIRLGFLGAISLGVAAIAASPFALPAIGSFLCTVGFNFANVLLGAGGTLTGLGLISRVAKKYAHIESDKWYGRAALWLGRNRFLDRVGFPLGLVSLFLGFSFGHSVPNTFVLGEWLQNNGGLLGGITIGIPGAATLASILYAWLGAKGAMRANAGVPAPYGDEAGRESDIRRTYRYSGTAFIFSLAYFSYRWIATSLFVSAAFFPISAGSVALTMGAVAVGYTAGHLLPHLSRRVRSPWFSFIGGTLGAVAAPLAAGALFGDYGSIWHSVSAVISLGVLSQDIHSTSHGAAFHKAQTSALFPDRLAPNVSMGEKNQLAGIYGRPEKVRTAFWEKAHVTPPDVVFSALTSAIYEPYAYLYQCLLQCDMPNRGEGKGGDKVRQIVRIRDESQQICDQLYGMARSRLDAVRRNPDDLEGNYRQLMGLLNELAQFYGVRMRELIKKMRDDFKQDWKGIYDASIDIGLKKGAEFAAQAIELAERLREKDQLSQAEVENSLLYFCDRFDVEFVLGVRKDSNEYTMRIQKNENQSGLREFIGNTGYEVTRFNPDTGKAEIQRILGTHIRRRNLAYNHSDASSKYFWHHRAGQELANDQQAIREYREKVKSHSKDLAFVINDNKGNPLAFQTWDGEILLIEERLTAPVQLRLADGREVTVEQRGHGFIVQGAALSATTVRKYNETHDNQIHLVADPAHPTRPKKIAELPDKAHDYYRDTEKRPLYTYAVDPHDYEFNLDSEFVNGRIALEYIPQFERDRQNKYGSVSYKYRRKVSLDYDMSGLPVDEHGMPLKPSSIQLNWAPMYMRVKARDGKEYIVPYLEEKNGQIEPKINDKKEDVTWQVFRDKYLKDMTKAEFTPVEVKAETAGGAELEFEFDQALFLKAPGSAAELARMLEASENDKKDKIKMKGEDIAETQVDWATFRDNYLGQVTAVEGGKTLKVETRHEYAVHKGINLITFELPAELFIVEAKKIAPTSAKQLRAMVERSGEDLGFMVPQVRTYNWRRIKRTDVDRAAGKLYFVYNTENGTEKRQDVPKHHSNQYSYSVHLPPLEEVVSVETEVFRKSVGTLPYARYAYRFESVEEAERAGNCKAAREDGKTERHENGHLRMKNGAPIWEVFDEDGKVIGYEIERFGRPESIFELGAFDPTSVDPTTVKLTKTRHGRKLTFEAVEWSTKLYPIEPKLMDLGTEDHPKARITGVVTDKETLKAAFGSGSILWAKFKNPANETEDYAAVKLDKRIRNPLSIMNVKYRGEQDGKTVLEVTRKQKHGDITLTDPAFKEMQHPADWVEKVEFGQLTEDGRRIKVFYKNPYSGLPLQGEARAQVLTVKHDQLKETENLADVAMELREIYDKKGRLTLTPYLKFTRVKKTLIKIDATPDIRHALATGELSILTPKSAFKVRTNDGREVLLPLNDRIDGGHYIFDAERATAAELRQYSHHLPHLEDGKVGLIIGPQLSISGRNWHGYALSGIPYCALDQSIFMAYDLSFGYNYGRQPYAYGVGGGNIQPGKSRAGDGRLREGTTVQNGTPVGRPLRKTLASGEPWNETESRVPFFSFAPMPATITEDYREGKGIYKKHGHSAIFNNKVVAIGAGVEDMSQILTQRRRWPTSVPIGQYWFFRDLVDEVFRSKIASLLPGAKSYPSHYTWSQLLHEWNGVTWYYCGMAEYMRSFAPLAYFTGFTAYPVDPIAFPLVWLGAFGSSMKSHTYSMAKVGNHWLESVYWGQAAYKALVPNFVEMLRPDPDFKAKTQGRRILEELVTCRLAKECLGQFGVTALAGGGKLDERYLRQISDDMWLKGAAFARGLLKMQDFTYTNQLLGGFGVDGFSMATTYFAIIMNTIWPYYDMMLNRGALDLAKNGPKGDPNFPDRERFYLIAQMIQGRLDYQDKKWWQAWKLRPGQSIRKNKMQYTLGITDWPKELKDQAGYLKDLSADELREVLSQMPQEAGPMLEKMMSASDFDREIAPSLEAPGYLVPSKVATIMEAMIYDNGAINKKAEAYFRKAMTGRKGRAPADILKRAQDEAAAEALFASGLAARIMFSLSEDHRRQVLASMKEDKRNILLEIMRQI